MLRPDGANLLHDPRAHLVAVAAERDRGALLDVRAERREPLTWAEELITNGDEVRAEQASTVPTRAADRSPYPIDIFAVFKGRRCEAQMKAPDLVDYEGKVYSSPSAAGIAVTGYNVNGWRFWKYVDPAGREAIIDRLRHT